MREYGYGTAVGTAEPHFVSEKEQWHVREAYAEPVSSSYGSEQAKWQGASDAERRCTVLRRGLSVLGYSLAGVAVLVVSSIVTGGEPRLSRGSLGQSDDFEGFFSAADDDCSRYEDTNKYTADSCALWDEYQCDMACFKGTTCAYLCGDACSKGEGAICSVQTVRREPTRMRSPLSSCISRGGPLMPPHCLLCPSVPCQMNSSTAFLAACARADSFTPTSNFSFPRWASERPPDDWNGNDTHTDDRYYTVETTSPFANSTGCDHHLECSFWTDFYKFLHDEARDLQDSGDVPNFLGSHMALLNDPWLKKLCEYATTTPFVGDDSALR